MMQARLFFLLGVSLAGILGQELCDENGKGQIDGIVPDSENQLLVVKGENYWKIDGNLTDGFSLSPGYPRKVQTRWPGLNVSVELAYYDLLSNLTYFVLDEQCWAFNGTELEPGYPQSTHNHPLFGSEEDDEEEDETIKAVVRLADENDSIAWFPFHISHIFMFNGTEFTKYRLPFGPIEPGYPKSIVPFWFQCPEHNNSTL